VLYFLFENKFISLNSIILIFDRYQCLFVELVMHGDYKNESLNIYLKLYKIFYIYFDFG